MSSPMFLNASFLKADAHARALFKFSVLIHINYIAYCDLPWENVVLR